MEFGIGSQFSREFNSEHGLIINELESTLNKCLHEKKYNSEIEKVYIGIICVSKGFDPFFMVRPLKILRKKPAIEYELKLEFDTFFKANIEQRIKILQDEFLIQSKEILSNKKIKKFAVCDFLNDVEECFLIVNKIFAKNVN